MVVKERTIPFQTRILRQGKLIFLDCTFQLSLDSHVKCFELKSAQVSASQINLNTNCIGRQKHRNFEVHIFIEFHVQLKSAQIEKSQRIIFDICNFLCLFYLFDSFHYSIFNFKLCYSIYCDKVIVSIIDVVDE